MGDERLTDDKSELKKKLGREAVDRFVQDGMRLGLGTGSTAIWAVRRVAERLAEGSLHGIVAVTTSLQSDLEARRLGIHVVTLNDSTVADGLDLAIDGADEIDGSFNLIKGGGGALLMEKVVAYSSQRLVIVADSTKLSPRLCDRFPVPVEVVAGALEPAARQLRAMGGEVSVREALRKAGPVVTDLGNLLLDVSFKGSFDPAQREKEIKQIPGVLENGLFTGRTPELLIGMPDGRLEHRKKA